jgi:hypothetical protein
MVKEIESVFPNLLRSGYAVTSPPDELYNCIAWGAGDMSRWWWPDAGGRGHWPAELPRTETLAAFEAMFAALGYAVCDHASLEAGFEKIALFADEQQFPTHAARQLPNGRWTSKLGELQDLEHALDDLTGIEYGAVVRVMKRLLPTVSLATG